MAFPKPKNPLKAPWPPGIDVRFINDAKRGTLVQLRPGAKMPDGIYLRLAGEAIARAARAARYDRPPCLN